MPQPTKSADAVDAPSIAYQRMAEKWQLIDDLVGGTQTMREAQQRWLPRETKEKWNDYQTRLGRSILYSALADTIDKTAARPFSKPVTLQGAELLPDQLIDIEEDADLMGSSLTAFARACFVDALKYGKCHILVDFPAAGTQMSLADERRAGVRPYFVAIPATDLIGWRGSYTGAGGYVLEQVRIRERRTEPEGLFGEQQVDYIRVYNRDSWELWRNGENKDGWAQTASGPQTLGYIPLITVYFNQTGVMEADPTFEDLAWLNLAHWQSYSDQRNLLRVARVPILSAVGLTQTEYEQGVTVGMSNLLKSTNPEARFGYVEHTGAALGAGEADLKTLEERMEVLGLQPLISRSGGITATAKSMDEARAESNIQTWIRATEHGLWQAYEVAADWVGQELSDDLSIDIYSDFGLTMKSAEDVQTLMALFGQGVITAETLLVEVKRRGIVSDMVDVEEEAQRARDTVPAGLLSIMSASGDEDEETEEEPTEAA